MRLTGLDHGVDSALPMAWLDAMALLQLNYDDAAMWYVWQYQKSPSGPINLAEEFVKMIEEKQVEVNNGLTVSVMDLVKTLLEHPKEVEIRIK